MHDAADADRSLLINALPIAAKQRQTESWKTIAAGVAIGSALFAIGASEK